MYIPPYHMLRNGVVSLWEAFALVVVANEVGDGLGAVGLHGEEVAVASKSVDVRVEGLERRGRGALDVAAAGDGVEGLAAGEGGPAAPLGGEWVGGGEGPPEATGASEVAVGVGGETVGTVGVEAVGSNWV